MKAWTVVVRNGRSTIGRGIKFQSLDGKKGMIPLGLELLSDRKITEGMKPKERYAQVAAKAFADKGVNIELGKGTILDADVEKINDVTPWPRLIPERIMDDPRILLFVSANKMGGERCRPYGVSKGKTVEQALPWHTFARIISERNAELLPWGWFGTTEDGARLNGVVILPPEMELIFRDETPTEDFKFQIKFRSWIFKNLETAVDHRTVMHIKRPLF